jgi:hypothetical protein
MPTTRSTTRARKVNLSKPEITNAVLSRLSAINLARLRTTSKAIKTAIDSKKNLRAKITKLGQRQSQLRTLLGRPQNENFRPIGIKHKDFRIGKIASKYFQRYNARPNPNGGWYPRHVEVYKMPAGQNVNIPLHGQIFHARGAHLEAQRMKRDKKTNLRKNGNRIYFEVPTRGRSFVFNKRRSEVSYNPGGGGFSLHYGVKLSNIFSKSNRRKIKAL